MNSKAAALIAVAVIVIAGWLIFRHNGADVNLEEGLTLPVGSGQVEVPAEETQTTTETSTVKEFTVTAGSFYFAPKTLTVNKGDTVKITLVNAGGRHDLKIDEFNATAPVIESGQSTTITFVADKTGSFEYYCSIGTHRQMGMVGTLTVK